MRLRVGSNVAVIAVLFGVSLLDSVRSRAWLEALLFAGMLAWALVLDSQGKNIGQVMRSIKQHDRQDIEPRKS